ncbi:hypothetical protein Tco_0908115 [Tanacetum coccineum]|uniref:Integrase, catalytic region, zinc finger, CCHC-type, peptidase aspartic, catalytic n=1 Tax=Tanacetum coccineum TaxID=301880 RepID=A0ABQ5CL76_9ASTR
MMSPLFCIQIPENVLDTSSSSEMIHSLVQPDHQLSEHNNKWTKDHPLENIISELGRPVSTRLQLHEQDLFCYYDAFLTSVEPKTYKEALTQACWIEAMQEELHEFKCLEVWELVPPLDKAMVITLKKKSMVSQRRIRGPDNPTTCSSLEKGSIWVKQAPRARDDMQSSFLISQTSLRLSGSHLCSSGEMARRYF